MSTRPKRVGSNISSIVQPILEKALEGSAANITVSPVDVNDFKLPIFNENVAPAS
jgi:hypothetical protein